VLTVQVASASRPIAGELECGDQLGIFTRGARTTIVLADGLGHGVEAVHAAKRAVARVAERPEAALPVLMHDLHASLAGTRGAAIALVRVDAALGRLEHASVGNVELLTLAHDSVRPITSPGIVGSRMRKVIDTSHRLFAGDLLVLYTDGVSRRLALEGLRKLQPQAIADAILRDHGKARDDAACVVIRC
jgi:serine phosphatase RsbU (regulator of sigma subunit)